MEGNNQAAPNDIEIQFESLETSIKQELDSLPSLSSSCCIYRVPERLRSVNGKAYTPKLVSIGPLHHGNETLKAMEEHKKRYLQDYLRRTQVSLKDYIQIIRDQEVRLRSCYAETIKFNSDDFVRIILVDAAFIIENILRLHLEEFDNENDRIWNKPEMFLDLWPDMLLLENQLPLFILNDLLILFDPNKITVSTETPPIINLSLKLFHYALQAVGVKEHNLERVRYPDVQVAHFLDLIRSLCEPNQVGQGRKLDEVSPAPSMTKLHQAGVKLKVKISTKNTFDIQFTDGILEIPELEISDHTEFIFRNLIAFEQCHYNETYISDYVHIMDRFVDSPKDVELLVEKGIFKNFLGDSSDVSTLINNLGIGVFSGNGYYYDALSEDLKKYCGLKWHKWNATLRQNYCNTPCATLSVSAAVILLVLTFIQTGCSIYSAYKA